jgi:hypothetical protein
MLTTERLLEHIKNNIELHVQKNETMHNINTNNNNNFSDEHKTESEKSIKQLKSPAMYQVLDIFNDDMFNGMLNDYNNQLVRFGSINYEYDSESDDDTENNENLSLVSSLLTIIKPMYKSLTYEQQLHNIRKLNEKFVHDFNSQNIFTFFDYTKYGWMKQSVFSDIKNHVNNKIVLKFMSDYFCINMWILFHDTNEIYLSYANNKCNTYRKNMILFYDSENQIYEPISKIDMETFIFDHDDDLIMHMFDNIDDVNPINIDLKKHSLDFSDMNTDILEHYSQINKPKIKKNKYNNDDEINVETKIDDVDEINVETKIDDVDEINVETKIDDVDEENVEIKNDNKKLFKKKHIDNEYNDNELNETITNGNTENVLTHSVTTKMKLKELQDIATLMNIQITHTINGKNKNKTKEQLVTHISKM